MLTGDESQKSLAFVFLKQNLYVYNLFRKMILHNRRTQWENEPKEGKSMQKYIVEYFRPRHLVDILLGHLISYRIKRKARGLYSSIPHGSGRRLLLEI